MDSTVTLSIKRDKESFEATTVYFDDLRKVIQHPSFLHGDISLLENLFYESQALNREHLTGPELFQVENSFIMVDYVTHRLYYWCHYDLAWISALNLRFVDTGIECDDVWIAETLLPHITHVELAGDQKEYLAPIQHELAKQANAKMWANFQESPVSGASPRYRLEYPSWRLLRFTFTMKPPQFLPRA